MLWTSNKKKIKSFNVGDSWVAQILFPLSLTIQKKKNLNNVTNDETCICLNIKKKKKKEEKIDRNFIIVIGEKLRLK